MNVRTRRQKILQRSMASAAASLCVGFMATVLLTSTAQMPVPSSLGTISLVSATASLPSARRFSPTYMDHSSIPLTNDQAVAAAQNFDVLLDQGAEFTPYLASMRAANPALRIYTYVNGVYSDPGKVYDPSTYSYDSSGRKIAMNTRWLLMDPTSSIWRTTILNRCRQINATSGYDGCFLDNLGASPFVPGYVTALPINPATGQVWLQSAWVTATSNLARSVVAGTTGLFVSANGLVSGARYFDSLASTKPLLNATTATMAESFLRGPATPMTSFVSESVWLKNVQMLSDAEASGGSVFATTKVWIQATSAQIDQWHTYALASFLMGTSGQSYFNFSSSQDFSGLTATAAQDQVDLGTPQSSVAKVAGVYQRGFAKGLVLVNPTKATVSVVLSSAYRDANGQTVTTVTLASNTGAILTSI